MNALDRIFGVPKPVIAMLHLPALPGRPLHDRAMGVNAAVESVGRDLDALQSAGVDGVLFCNEADLPYQLRVGPEITAAMASVIGQIRGELRVPFGVNLLWDAVASLAVARATGARFIREVLTGVYAIARRHDLIVTNVFHAGDGNLHPLFSFDLTVPGTLQRVLAAADEVVRLCVDAGGALSGEHGIGLEKRDFMPLVFTDEDLGAQACVRMAFDPDGRMNPQKVLPSGARCGDFAAAALARAGQLPEGTWI